MNYLDFVEDYKKNKDISLFEKIIRSELKKTDGVLFKSICT